MKHLIWRKKMKKKIIYFGALLTISLSGCSIINGSKSEELEEGSFHEIAENSTYTSTEMSLQDLSLESVGGGVVIDNELYLSDEEAGKINVYNESYELIDEIEQDSILSPTLLAGEGESLYIIDIGLKSILHVDKQTHEIVETIPFPVEIHEPEFLSLVVKDTALFLTYDSNQEKTAHIFKIDLESKQVSEIGELFSGSIHEDEFGDLYALELGEYYKDNDSEGFESGENSLYKVIDNKLVEEVELPYKLTALDFLLKDDHIITYTYFRHSVVRLDKQGNLIDSLATFDPDYVDYSLVLLEYNHDILVLGRQYDQIFKLSK